MWLIWSDIGGLIISREMSLEKTGSPFYRESLDFLKQRLYAQYSEWFD